MGSEGFEPPTPPPSCDSGGSVTAPTYLRKPRLSAPDGTPVAVLNHGTRPRPKPTRIASKSPTRLYQTQTKNEKRIDRQSLQISNQKFHRITTIRVQTSSTASPKDRQAGQANMPSTDLVCLADALTVTEHRERLRLQPLYFVVLRAMTHVEITMICRDIYDTRRWKIDRFAIDFNNFKHVYAPNLAPASDDPAGPRRPV